MLVDEGIPGLIVEFGICEMSFAVASLRYLKVRLQTNNSLGLKIFFSMYTDSSQSTSSSPPKHCRVLSQMNSSSTQIFNPFHFPLRATQDNFSPQFGSGEDVSVRHLFTFPFSSNLCFCPISQTLCKCCFVPGTAVFIGHPGPQSPQLPF